jgi:hypothetical protein
MIIITAFFSDLFVGKILCFRLPIDSIFNLTLTPCICLHDCPPSAYYHTLVIFNLARLIEEQSEGILLLLHLIKTEVAERDCLGGVIVAKHICVLVSSLALD